MTYDKLLNELWTTTLTRLGGEAEIAASARETRAFVRPREIKSAIDLLRIILAYCLGDMGLRSTSAWAASIGLADLSNVALLGRLRNSTAWLEHLVGVLLASSGGGQAVKDGQAQGRPIRLLDATTVRKARLKNRRSGELWRIHAAFDLPSERFTYFEVSDEKDAERFDRVAVAPGEIRIGDRGYMSSKRIAAVASAGGDFIVRSGWRQVRWLDEAGNVLNLAAVLNRAKTAKKSDVIDRPVSLWIKGKSALKVRLVAIRKPAREIEKSRARVRREAAKESAEIADGTLIAAEWVLLVTSLSAEEFSAADIGELYRARWRIEIAFKRLKSLIGLAGPPGQEPKVAKTWILAHLLMALLLEPHTSQTEASEAEVSPRSPVHRRAA